jgi:hypothetical protein
MPPFFLISAPFAWLGFLAAVAGAAVILWRRRRLQGTTLLAPAAWWCLSLAALAAVEFCAAWFAGESSGPLPHLEMLAAGTMFCPFLAVLGAKRPQDRGWQFIVASLVGVLWFYGLTNLAFWPGLPPKLPWVVRWLLIVPLWGMGLLDSLPTGRWLSGVLTAVGQALWLAPLFPEFVELRSGVGWPLWNEGAAMGLGTASFAAGAILWIIAVTRSVQSPPSLNRIWLDFRDAFGSFWALRVAARFNQSAELNGWSTRVTWQGFQQDASAGPTGTADADLRLAQQHAIENLLRRFVDTDWMNARGLPTDHGLQTTNDQGPGTKDQ